MRLPDAGARTAVNVLPRKSLKRQGAWSGWRRDDNAPSADKVPRCPQGRVWCCGGRGIFQHRAGATGPIAGVVGKSHEVAAIGLAAFAFGGLGERAVFQGRAAMLAGADSTARSPSPSRPRGNTGGTLKAPVLAQAPQAEKQRHTRRKSCALFFASCGGGGRNSHPQEIIIQKGGIIFQYGKGKHCSYNQSSRGRIS
jgi:hypothetical protein